jgi:hypothetical protein
MLKIEKISRAPLIYFASRKNVEIVEKNLKMLNQKRCVTYLITRNQINKETIINFLNTLCKQNIIT